MRKGLKLSSIVALVLLTLVTLSFKNTITTENEAAAGKKVTAKSVNNATISPRETFNEYVLSVYNRSGLAESGLDYQVFLKGMTGYHNLKDLNILPAAKEILSVVDFSKPSTEKRLWVIDLKAQKVLFNTFVAHGQGSGEVVAKKFSNVINSFQSSVGFYSTAEVYTGKHGQSLKLDGLDANLNGMARERAIVIHGADYVSQDVINRTGRLGRSQGCPALPMDLFADVINNIEGNTLLFINGEGVDTSDFLKGVDHNDSKNEA